MKDEIKELPKEQQKLKDYLDNVTIEQIIKKLEDDDGMTWWVDYQDQYQPNWKKLYGKEVKLLLDYITTLQEENERLKAELNNLKPLDLHTNKYKYIKYEIEEILKRQKARIDKAIEIYENSSSIEYKQKRFMEDKTTADLMYEALQGGDK